MLDAARGVAEGSDYDATLEEIVVTYGGPTNIESGRGQPEQGTNDASGSARRRS